MYTYYYIPNVSINEWPLNIDDAFQYHSYYLDISKLNILEENWLVEEMAKDFFRNHDGWELARSWECSGMSFAVWDSNKEFVGKYNVLLEYMPSFTVHKEERNEM